MQPPDSAEEAKTLQLNGYMHTAQEIIARNLNVPDLKSHLNNGQWNTKNIPSSNSMLDFFLVV